MNRPAPWIMAAVLMAATVALAALLTSLRPVVPQVHDEFSYSLAADTFAHGRMTNPSPDCWRSFESFHTILQPTYASKYPPLQGLFLAAGQLLSGDPVVGLWIASALATLCAYWMLLGWVPRRTADLAALLVVLHPGLQLAWGQSYWGGTVAFAAGALVWGAVPRLQRLPNARDAVMMAVGAAMLANSRPYEGLVAVLMAAAMIVAGWVRPGWAGRARGTQAVTVRQMLARVLLPQLGVMIPVFIAMAGYNHAVTGSWTNLPYQVHEETYARSPNFLWQPPLEDKAYQHDVMAGFFRGWALDCYLAQDTWPERIASKLHWSGIAAQMLLPWPLAIACLGGLVSPVRRTWPVMVAIVGGWLASMVTVWSLPHYMAPSIPLLFILAAQGLRSLRVCTRRWMPALQFGSAPIVISAQVLVFAIAAWHHITTPPAPWAMARERIIEQFTATGEQHLIVVRYGADHNPHHEWVYNGADLEADCVLWAREADASTNERLLTHYNARRVWLLEPDATPPRLVPYPTTPPSGG